MTVGSAIYWNGPSTGNGVTRVFGFTFPVTQKADVVVLLDGVPAAGNYVVTFTDPDNPLGGGNVTFDLTFEPASGVSVLVIRRLEYLQSSALPSQGAFNAQVVERAFDRVVMLTQQVSSRALMVPDVALGDGFDPALPDPDAANAGDALLLNSDKDGFRFGSPVSVAVTGDVALALTQSTLSGFRDAIGLEIGADVQAYDADTAKLDVVQTWTAAQSFNGGASFGHASTVSISNATPSLTLTDTDTGSDCRINASSSSTTGSLRIEADINNELASSTILFYIDGANVVTMGATGSITGASASNPRWTITHSGGTASTLVLGSDSGSSWLGTTTNTSLRLTHNNSQVLRLDAGVFAPVTNDGIALGSTSLGFADLHLATGGTINWANNAMLTHSTGLLASSVPIQAAVAVSSETSGTLTSASRNKQVDATGDITINDGVFTAKDRLEIYAGASARAITQDTGMTLRLDGTSTTGSRTLAARGRAALYFVSDSEAIVSGAGVT